MKKIFLILLLAVLIGGCESARKTTNDKIGSNKAFPKALAAVWEGYYSQVNWVIKFTPDGRIEYVKIPFGEFVGPNSEAVFDANDSNYTTVIKTGKFQADYNPDGTLDVSLEIINFDGMTPIGRIEMKGTEYLTGNVDLDKGIWNAAWLTHGNYWVTPLGEERALLPGDDNEVREMTLKRLIRKDTPRIHKSLEPNLPQSTN
ncbi:MAG: hypothetical protein ABR969_09770 [Sedimentisphaerales bacterium]|jgi:uncharacterized protein YceK